MHCYCYIVLTVGDTVVLFDKNSSGYEIANMNFHAVHLEGTQIR